MEIRKGASSEAPFSFMSKPRKVSFSAHHLIENANGIKYLYASVVKHPNVRSMCDILVLKFS